MFIQADSRMQHCRERQGFSIYKMLTDFFEPRMSPRESRSHRIVKFSMFTHLPVLRGFTEGFFKFWPRARDMGHPLGGKGGQKMLKIFFLIFPIFLLDVTGGSLNCQKNEFLASACRSSLSRKKSKNVFRFFEPSVRNKSSPFSPEPAWGNFRGFSGRLGPSIFSMDLDAENHSATFGGG